MDIIPGQGTRLAKSVPPQREPIQLTVGLLSPGPIEVLFPRQILWVDKLRSRLAGTGYILKSHHGQHYFQGDPSKAIHRLVEREACSCWLLVSSSKEIQDWFEGYEVPCLVAGSCHTGVDLPFVDIDYQALCRHAATTLLRSGHRHIAYLSPTPVLAGDLFSEKGFNEGIATSPAANGEIIHLELSTDRIAHTVNRLIRRRNRPSALLVHNALQFLTVFSVLTKAGLAIPDDISLICRESETFLSYMDPVPCRYSHDPAKFAEKLAGIIAKLTSGTPVQTKANLIMPDYHEGGSINKVTIK